MMRRRSLLSLSGAVLGGLLLVGTARLEWSTSRVLVGPAIELGAEENSVEFNIDLSLEMCEPGPEGEPVSLFLDLSAGFEQVESTGMDSGEMAQLSVTLYPSDGSPAVSDSVDLSDGSGGLYLVGNHIQCPAFGSCERSYVAVFEASEGILSSGWWTLTASAIGPRKSEGEYQGSISLQVEKR
jgi:hypothetical protein